MQTATLCPLREPEIKNQYLNFYLFMFDRVHMLTSKKYTDTPNLGNCGSLAPLFTLGDHEPSRFFSSPLLNNGMGEGSIAMWLGMHHIPPCPHPQQLHSTPLFPLVWLLLCLSLNRVLFG